MNEVYTPQNLLNTLVEIVPDYFLLNDIQLAYRLFALQYELLHCSDERGMPAPIPLSQLSAETKQKLLEIEALLYRFTGSTDFSLD